METLTGYIRDIDSHIPNPRQNAEFRGNSLASSQAAI